MAKALSVGEYLVAGLEQAGLKHVFGIPGDYVLGFYDLLDRSDAMERLATRLAARVSPKKNQQR